MENIVMASVAGVTVICYLLGLGVKLSPLDNKWIPLLCGILGAGLGLLGMRLIPAYPADNLIDAAAVGIVSGLAATGIDQIGKQLFTEP